MRTCRSTILTALLIILSFVLTSEFTLAAIPRQYKGMALGMDRAGVERSLQQLWPEGGWIERDDSPGVWEWIVSGSAKFQGRFIDDRLFAFWASAQYLPPNDALREFTAQFGVPMHYEVFDQTSYIVAWADGTTVAILEANGYRTTVLMKDDRTWSGPALPTEVRGLKLGMPKKDAVRALGEILPGLDPQSGRGVLRDNGLRDRQFIETDDARISLSFVGERLAEVSIWPSDLVENLDLNAPEAKFGKERYWIESQETPVWFDDKTVLSRYQNGIRLASRELYQKGLLEARDAGPDWNTEDVKAETNGNYRIAREELKKTTTEKLLKGATEVNLAQVLKTPRVYIGKLVRFTGKVMSIEEFRPGTDESYRLNDGGVATVAQLKGGPDGKTGVLAVQLGGAGGAGLGRSATVVGYVVGTMVLEDETGKSLEHVCVVSRVMNIKQ